jgi:NADH-quinone oxidoreductase subunit L
MTFPLIILAILSTAGGFLGLPEVFSEKHLLHEYLSPILSFPTSFSKEAVSHGFEIGLMVSFVVVLSALIFVAYKRFTNRDNVPSLYENEFSSSQKLAFNKFYVDELYDKLIVKPLYALSDLFYKIIDIKFIDGIVNSVQRVVNAGSQQVRLVQTGYVGFYIFAMVFGIIAILVFNLIIK